MLGKKEFDNFILEVDKLYQVYCVWVYANNNFLASQYKFNDVHDNEDCRFTNFWSIVIPALQQNFILRLARLLDRPYLDRDSKKKNPRLSTLYILEQLGDNTIIVDYQNMMAEKNMVEFVASNKHIRNNVLAHKNVGTTGTLSQKNGMEKYFEILEKIILSIKSNHKHLNVCASIDFKYIDKLSKKGIDEIFEALNCHVDKRKTTV